MSALGQPFEHQRTGVTFNAIFINVPPVDPRLDLGADLREMSTLEASRDKIPQGMKLGDVVQQSNPPWNTSEFQQFPYWKLVRREDNGANFTIKFWAVHVTDKDTQP